MPTEHQTDIGQTVEKLHGLLSQEHPDYKRVGEELATFCRYLSVSADVAVETAYLAKCATRYANALLKLCREFCEST